MICTVHSGDHFFFIFPQPKTSFKYSEWNKITGSFLSCINPDVKIIDEAGEDHYDDGGHNGH